MPQNLRLFALHRGSLVDYANGIVGDRDNAEDLVQEAWLRFDQASRKALLDQPLSYLYRIVRNLALDYRRHRMRETRIVLSGIAADLVADGTPSQERAVHYKDELELVMAAMAELPERTRIALEMSRIGGCKLKEIAAFLDISVPMAHLLVVDGVQHCKHRLGWP